MLSTDVRSNLESRLKQRTAQIAVIGLGYVGLPLAMRYARAGFHVIGIDQDASRVEMVNRGEDYVHDRALRLEEVIASGRLTAVHGWEPLSTADAIIICVPTPLTRNREPDMSCVAAAARQVAMHLRRGQLVVLESTTYPGTTEDFLLPLLTESGLQAGVDYHLAFSPERVDPGNPQYDTGNTCKIVGGLTPTCSELARTLYEQVVETVRVATSPRTAEMVKLLENIFRCVNIALVNELALLSRRMGIDIWEVVQLAATKPYGFMPFQPGPGMGGHCIPIDPFYLTWKAREFGFQTRFIELAGEINAHMPDKVVDILIDALGTRRKALRGARVLVLGAAYKRDVADCRESPSLKILENLTRRGALADYNDPHIPSLRLNGTAYQSVSLDGMGEYDCVLIATDHTAYDFARIVRESQLVVDTRNATQARGMEHVFVL